MFADSNFGIEIAGKQKGTTLGLWDPNAGDGRSADSPWESRVAPPWAWRGAAAGLALQPLRQQDAQEEGSC